MEIEAKQLRSRIARRLRHVCSKLAVFLAPILLSAPMIAAQNGASSATSLPAPPRAAPGTVAGSVPLTELAFPGGVKLEIENDPMTDRRSCTAFTPMSAGVYVGFSRPSAMIWTSEYWPVEHDAPALLRVGDGSPFDLKAVRRLRQDCAAQAN